MKKPIAYRNLILGLALSLGSVAGAAPLRILAPATEGGGWDNTARAIATTLKLENLAPEITVYNIPGKGGTIGLEEFVKLRGKSSELMVMGFVMMAGISVNKSPYSLNTDVTPIARLTTDYEVFAVPKKSSITDIESFVKAFKASPTTLKLGGSSVGGSGHIAFAEMARVLKIPANQVRYIPSAGGEQATKAMLAGDLDIVSAGYSELEPFIKAGTVKGIAILAPQTVTGINLPSLSKQGYDVDVSNWRGIVAPAGISQAEKARLTLMITKMARSRTWQQQLSKNKWNSFLMSGNAFDSFLEAQRGIVSQQLSDLGLLK